MWESIQDMTSVRCYCGAVVSSSGKLIVSGGSNSIWRDGHTLDTVEAWEASTGWVEQEYKMRSARSVNPLNKPRSDGDAGAVTVMSTILRRIGAMCLVGSMLWIRSTTALSSS